MQTLETLRLVLRPFRDDAHDAAFVYDLYSRWEVARYLGPEPAVMTDPAQGERAVARWSALDHDVHGVWAVQSRETGAPIGVALLQVIPVSPGEPDDGDVEVGWQLHPDAWGNGFATEATVAVIKHALAHDIPRVVAVTYPENTRSRRVAERVGMTYRGRSRRYYGTEADLFDISGNPFS